MNFLIFPTPIKLDILDFSIQEALNMSLKLQKYMRKALYDHASNRSTKIN